MIMSPPCLASHSPHSHRPRCTSRQQQPEYLSIIYTWRLRRVGRWFLCHVIAILLSVTSANKLSPNMNPNYTLHDIRHHLSTIFSIFHKNSLLTIYTVLFRVLQLGFCATLPWLRLMYSQFNLLCGFIR